MADWRTYKTWGSVLYFPFVGKLRAFGGKLKWSNWSGHPEELANHQAVKFFSAGGATDDTFDLIVDGEARKFTAGGWISVNDAESYAVCALRGCGLIQVPRYHVEDALGEGRLVEVLSEWPSPELPVSALYPHRRHLSPRVRVFVDWISEIYEEKFGAHLASASGVTEDFSEEG